MSPTSRRKEKHRAAQARADAERIAPGASRFPLLTDTISPASLPLFAENIRRGAKPAGEWRCGVEFELFGYDARRDYARLNPAQVQSTLSGFAPSSNDLVYEGDVLVEVGTEQQGRLTVEPGGQIEFSGAPQRSLQDIERELRRFLARLGEIAAADGLTFLAVGFDPLRALAEQHWFPKRRYAVMRPFLAARGARGWDMMCRTCAAQANLDYDGAADLAQKFLVGNRLAPIVTAIFANSPFALGKPSGYKSTRALAWLETDGARAGLAPPALADDFSPEQFVAYALDVPMIFAQRDGQYLSEPSGMKFRDFLAHGCAGLRPIFGDWADHLTTIFTDLRLKQHIELRSADGGNLAHTLALTALWKGIMYDPSALDEALRLAPKLDRAGAHALRQQVARAGLQARHAEVNVLGLAQEVVRLAAQGLSRIAPDETAYLDILREQVLADEVCPADILLRNWHGSWQGSMSRVVEYLRIA